MITRHGAPTPTAIAIVLSVTPDVVVVVDAGLTLTSPDADDVDDVRVTDDAGVGTVGFFAEVRLDDNGVVVVVVVVVLLDT